VLLLGGGSSQNNGYSPNHEELDFTSLFPRFWTLDVNSSSLILIVRTGKRQLFRGIC
jgi:hypothetical protein